VLIFLHSSRKTYSSRAEDNSGIFKRAYGLFLMLSNGTKKSIHILFYFIFFGKDRPG